MDDSKHLCGSNIQDYFQPGIKPSSALPTLLFLWITLLCPIFSFSKQSVNLYFRLTERRNPLFFNPSEDIVKHEVMSPVNTEQSDRPLSQCQMHHPYGLVPVVPRILNPMERTPGTVPSSHFSRSRESL